MTDLLIGFVAGIFTVAVPAALGLAVLEFRDRRTSPPDPIGDMALCLVNEAEALLREGQP